LVVNLSVSLVSVGQQLIIIIMIIINVLP